MSSGGGGQTDGGDIEQAVETSRGGLGDPFPEAQHIERARGPHIQPGGHTAARGHRVGVDAPEGDVVIDVGVQVDQAGGDDLAAGVHHPGRALGGDVGFDGGHPVAPDAHIQSSALAAGVDDFAAFDE